MAKNEQVNNFAIKYYKLYLNPKIAEQEVDTGFAELCRNLGFEMDLGESLIKRYGNAAFYHSNALDKVIENVDDVAMLGNAILSKWRYITHWAQSSLLETDNKEWFIKAFKKMADITAA